jgi:hypothetical protein
MRELKITTIQGIIFLYPVPVIKEKKYLIRCESLEKANELIQEISNQKIQHPDNGSPDFQFVSLHTDQQTKIFIYFLTDKPGAPAH